INECLKTAGICGDHANCSNTVGSYLCTCMTGFAATNPALPAGQSNLCIDIDECVKYDSICGPNSNCTNLIGSYNCTCLSGYRLNNPDVIANECTETPGICGKNTICTNVPGTFYCSCPEGFYPSTGIVWTLGTSYCQSRFGCNWLNHTPYTVLLYSDLSMMTFNLHITSVPCSPLCGHFQALHQLPFLTLSGMESLLSHEYFQSENITEMYSDVISAFLPSMNNTNLTEPVNFTIQHKKDSTGTDGSNTGGQGDMRWSVTGCWASFTNENYTVCSCSHLSTFALILQIAEPQPEDTFLVWLNQMCVSIGLFFFALAIFTFLLCSWNPKINNTARLHLCINTALSQLLLLWDDKYVNERLACKVMAGLLHFIVVASFVWMLLEALQLHLLVRRLSKVQVIQRDGLPRPLLYLVGYGVPFVIVGVSALVYSDGYGATDAQVCWLSQNRNFKWALTGPVITVLGLNCALFGATLWSLRPTLASMKSDVSQSKDTRLILFKILAQFVILGCTWILGLYQSNLFFKVVFIILNSQQGTFLYVVHCLLNKEVREEYMKWLTCSFNKPTDGGSVVS
uniref:Adhesion G protein-coupled receptor E8 n=1 Tax=Anabas testudineus TaxID=64144 RepID=A0A3Q1JRT6_ANATE